MSSDALTNEKPRGKTSPWLLYGAPVLAVAVILGAVLGGVLGSRAANKSNKNANVAAGDSSSSSSSSLSTHSSAIFSTASSTSTKGAVSSSSTSTTVAASATSAAAGFVVTPLPQWHWGTDKAIGICTGNWLILERWMDEDWFVATAGANAWDEWDFTTVLGSGAVAALQTHYSSWITEADFEIMYQNGMNHVRIPTGFWSWIPTVSGEPYVDAGALGYVEQAMQWAYKRGMYILLDLHGLPGSQNGEESSGHNTTSPSWFGNTVNQNRSDAMVQTVMTWLETNPYRSVISGLEVINEPRPYTAGQMTELQNYYERSYTTVQASSWPVAVFVHPGFFEASPLTWWQPFMAAHATSPPSMVYEDHPYPGNFPPQTDTSSILTQVCAAAQKYLGYPVPVAITEWSLYTGVKTTSFETTFFEDQLVAWAWSAGGFYWSYKLIPSQLQLQGSPSLDYSQYSFITLVQNATGTIPTPATAGLSNTTTTSNAAAYLNSFSGNCGTVPSNVAPYDDGTFTVEPWTAVSSALSVASTTTLTATGAPVRRRRHFHA